MFWLQLMALQKVTVTNLFVSFSRFSYIMARQTKRKGCSPCSVIWRLQYFRSTLWSWNAVARIFQWMLFSRFRWQIWCTRQSSVIPCHWGNSKLFLSKEAMPNVYTTRNLMKTHKNKWCTPNETTLIASRISKMFMYSVWIVFNGRLLEVHAYIPFSLSRI